MAFGTQTISRLIAVLEGLVPTSALVLLLSALGSGRTAMAGCVFSCVGLALGAAAGLFAGRWLRNRNLKEADRRLPLVLTMIFLPLAVLSTRPKTLGVGEADPWGWAFGLLALALAFPLGAVMGCARSCRQVPDLHRRSRLVWGGSGVGLGAVVSACAATILAAPKGAFLVNLFAAPLVWPILPARGARTLLVRMLLTLVVLLSTMFLLF